MAVGEDYKVARRFRESISEIASEWRSAAPGGLLANRFDVAQFLVETVLPTLTKKGRRVALKIVDTDAQDPEAWVDLEKGELCVQEWVWDMAKAQHEHGRLVIAHEIGHLVLHADQKFAFSRGQEKKLGFLDPSESAEAQANWFASAFLLPDEALLRCARMSEEALSILTLVSKRVVQVRREEVARDKRYRRYSGDECSNCGSSKVVATGPSLVCEECGESKVEAGVVSRAALS